MIVMTVTYVRSWRKGTDSGDVTNSFVAMGFDECTAGAVMMNCYVERVTAPAYAISYMFYQGPASLIRIYEYQQSRIAPTIGVVNELTMLRDSLRSVNKWQDVFIYEKHGLGLIYLALLELIDLDLVKGRVKYSGD